MLLERNQGLGRSRSLAQKPSEPGSALGVSALCILCPLGEGMAVEEALVSRPRRDGPGCAGGRIWVLTLCPHVFCTLCSPAHYVLPGRHLPPLGLSRLNLNCFCVAGQCTLRSSGCFSNPALPPLNLEGDAWCREMAWAEARGCEPCLCKLTSARRAGDGRGEAWAGLPLSTLGLGPGWPLCPPAPFPSSLMLKSLCL